MKQVRIAAEYSAPAADSHLAAIDRQQRRFAWLSIATMIVSFIHMVGALLLFSDGSILGSVAAVLMTGLVDGATWVVTGYYDYAKRRNLKRGRLVALLLLVALLISCGLNLAYLIGHMPATLPPLLGVAIAVAFALFIPLCIAVASSERGQLEDDKATTMERTVVNVATVAPPPQPAAILPAPHPRNQLRSRAQPRRRAKPVNVDTVAPPSHPVAPDDDRIADWLAQRNAGATYTAIAAQAGVSRQYVTRLVAPLVAPLVAATTPPTDAPDAP